MKKYIKQIRTDLNRLLAVRAESGPYRYLIKSWHSISDINLAADVLGVDIFRAQLKPVNLPVNKIDSFLVIAPHQDDEVIGAGGTLLLAKKANAKINLLFVTDGAQRSEKYKNNKSELISVRRQEAKRVCEELNAAFYELNISNIAPQPSFRDIFKLHQLIEEIKPQVVLCPWLLDSPSKHRMANHMLLLAEKYKNLPDFEIWGYQVHNSLIPNGIVDITETAAEKQSLIECYKSQNQNFHRYDHQAMGLAAWNSRYLGRDTKKKYAEIFFTLPKKEYLGLVEKFYLNNLRETYLGHAGLIESFEKLHWNIANNNFNQYERNSNTG